MENPRFPNQKSGNQYCESIKQQGYILSRPPTISHILTALPSTLRTAIWFERRRGLRRQIVCGDPEQCLSYHWNLESKARPRIFGTEGPKKVHGMFARDSGLGDYVERLDTGLMSLGSATLRLSTSAWEAGFCPVSECRVMAEKMIQRGLSLLRLDHLGFFLSR